MPSDLLSPRTALHLVLQCYNPRPAYLLRTTANINDVAASTRLFDESICDAVASILRTTPTSDFQTRCYLPRKFGGLGLSRHYGMSTEKSQILSRMAFYDFLALHHPSEYQLISNHFNRTDIQLGQREHLEDHTGLDEAKMLALVNPSARGILSSAKSLAYQKQSDEILAFLADSPTTQQHAAWMLSSTDSSTNFIHSSIGLGSEGYFSSEEFICIARAKLGIAPSNDLPGQFRVCACQKSFDAAEDSLHGLSCALNKGHRNVRHDSIRDLLYQLIKRLNNGIQQTHLSLEFEVGQIQPPNEPSYVVRTDIKYIKGADTFYIDVAIIDPASAESQKAPTRSHLTQDAASSRYERIKRQHYSRVNSPAAIPPGYIVPFVIEATGRLGPAALLFLHSLCGTQTFSRSNFLSEINLICARTAGRMLKMTRDRFQGLPEGVLMAPMRV